MSGRKATTNIIPGRIALSVGKPLMKLPKNWQWVLLSEVATLATGHTPSKKKPEYWGGDIPWMSVGDARKRNGKRIFETKQHTNSLGIDNSAAVLLPENTVCLSRTASIGYVILLGRPMATSQGFVNWICSEQLSPRFLQMLFLAENQFLYEISEGTAHTTIYYPEVKAFTIAMPSRSEQDRIVDKVDSLMAKVEVMKKSLERIPQLLKDFRQQVLTQAVTGKLTEKWRNSETKTNWQNKTLEEVSIEIFDGPFGSNLKTKDYISSGIKVVRLENVKSMFYDNTKQAFVSQEKYDSLKRNHLKVGDLLMSTFVSKEIRATILPKSATPSINKSDVLCLRLNENILLKKYCLYFLLSTEGENQINNLAHGMTRPRINTKNLRSIKPDIPPIAEQEEIIYRVERLFLTIKKIEHKYKTLKEKINSLPQAILHKAFKGELLEQLPTDGDAKVLLKEIEKLKGKKSVKKEKETKNKSSVEKPGIAYQNDKQAIDALFETINYDYEVAAIQMLTERRFGFTYGKKYTHKMFSNIELLNTMPKFKDLAFEEKGWGMFSKAIAKTIDAQRFVYSHQLDNGVKVLKVKSNSFKEVLDWTSKKENKEFVTQVNALLDLYEKPLINKDMNRIELFNTVLECMKVLETDNLQAIRGKMSQWPMTEGGYKNKAEKFIPNETLHMIGFVKEILK